MVEKIKALKKYTDCAMPANENDLRIRESISGYNQAIEDVVNLFSIPVVSNCADSSKRPKPYEWLKVEKFNITQGSTYNEPKFSMRQCASWISEYVKKHCC